MSQASTNQAYFDEDYYTGDGREDGYGGYGPMGPGYLLNHEDGRSYSWDEHARVILRKFPEATTFLDIGCATGRVLEAIVRVAKKDFNRDVKCWGLDISEWAVENQVEDDNVTVAVMDVTRIGPAAVMTTFDDAPPFFDVIFSFSGGVTYIKDDGEWEEMIERIMSLARVGVYFEVPVNPEEAGDPHVVVRDIDTWVYAMDRYASWGMDVFEVRSEDTLMGYPGAFMAIERNRTFEYKLPLTAYTLRIESAMPRKLHFGEPGDAMAHNLLGVGMCWSYADWMWISLFDEYGELVAEMPHPEIHALLRTGGGEDYVYLQPHTPSTAVSYRYYCKDPKYLVYLFHAFHELAENKRCRFIPENFLLFLKYLFPEEKLREVYGENVFLYHDSNHYCVAPHAGMTEYVADVGRDSKSKMRGNLRRDFRGQVEKLGLSMDATTLDLDLRDPEVRNILHAFFDRHGRRTTGSDDVDGYFRDWELCYSRLLLAQRDHPKDIRRIPVYRDGKLWGVDIWIKLPFTADAEGKCLWERAWFAYRNLTDEEKKVGAGKFFLWAASVAMHELGDMQGLSHGVDGLEIIDSMYPVWYYKPHHASFTASSLSMNTEATWGKPNLAEDPLVTLPEAVSK